MQAKPAAELETPDNAKSGASDDSNGKNAPLVALLELGDLIQQKRREQRQKKSTDLPKSDQRSKLEEWR